MRRKGRLQIVVGMLGLMVVIVALAQGRQPGKLANTGTELAVLTDEEEAFAAHWRQFGEDYRSPLTVAEQIETAGLVNPLLLKAHVGRHLYVIGWDSEKNELIVNVDGVDGKESDRLFVVEDESGKLHWRIVLVESIEQRSGKVKVETAVGFVAATGDSFIVEIDCDDGAYRFETMLHTNQATASGDNELVVGAETGAKCVCWGKPPKGTCSTTNCDDGKGCGTEKTCTWRANYN